MEEESKEQDEFGDFEEVKEEDSGKKPVVAEQGEQEVSARVKLPHKGELIGVVVQRLGGNKMEVKATDGKTRNSRVPGRFKRRMWLRPGNFVIIAPWESDDSKADIIYQYRGNQINQLRRRGLLDRLREEF